jgi:uncharacterized protein
MTLDRWTNLKSTPAFLAHVGVRDREPWRVLAFVALWPIGGLITGALIFFTVMSFSDELSHQFPELVRGLRAAPLGRVPVAQVEPHIGLIGETRRILLLAAGPAGFAISVPLAGFYLMHRPARSWFTSSVHFRWRMLFAGLVMFSGVTGLAMLFDGLIHGFPKSPPLLRSDESPAVRGVYFGLTLFAMTAAASAEEVITRGWLMQQTAVFTRNLAVIVCVNAAVFSLVHLDPDPGRNLALFVSGVCLSLIAVRTGGLEFGIGVHAANNLMLVWFSTPFRVEDLGGRINLVDLLIQLSVTVSGLGLAELAMRWRAMDWVRRD